jgi:hypothetical protein
MFLPGVGPVELEASKNVRQDYVNDITELIWETIKTNCPTGVGTFRLFRGIPSGSRENTILVGIFEYSSGFAETSELRGVAY